MVGGTANNTSTTSRRGATATMVSPPDKNDSRKGKSDETPAKRARKSPAKSPKKSATAAAAAAATQASLPPGPMKDPTEAEPDARQWAGTDDFLSSFGFDVTMSQAKSAFDDAVASAKNKATSSENQVIANIVAQNEKFVSTIKQSLAEMQSAMEEKSKEIDTAKKNYEEQAERFKNRLENVSKDSEVQKQIAVLDQLIREKNSEISKYRELLASFRDKETVIQVIAERKKTLDIAILRNQELEEELNQKKKDQQDEKVNGDDKDKKKASN